MSYLRHTEPVLLCGGSHSFVGFPELNTIAAYSDDEDILDVIEYLYSRKCDVNFGEETENIHKRLFSETEHRFII